MIQVTKYDRNGHKPRPRIVVVTKETFYLLDGKNYKLKLSVTYDKIKGRSQYLSFCVCFDS